MFKILKNKKLWLSLVIVILLTGAINFTTKDLNYFSPVQKLIQTVYTPLQSGVYGVAEFFRGFSDVFVEKKYIIKQNNKLQKENDRLKLENQKLREDHAELERLRNIVAFENNNKNIYDLIPAQVIARSPNNWYKCLTINKGLQDGINTNMSVISPDGLVGRIINVNNNTARVFLITDREMAVGAILQPTRETNGIVEGRGDSTLLHMVNIPYYSKVEQGDRVITSGLSEYFPKGIVIGYIKKVSREPNGLLLSATVRPAVDFDKLEEVLVISGYRPPVEEETEK